MYTKKMVEGWFERFGTPYVCVIGYDGDQHLDYTDVVVLGVRSLPTYEDANHFMSQYMPSIKGSLRRLIWIEAFDMMGKIDLDELFKNHNFTHVNLNKDLE